MELIEIGQVVNTHGIRGEIKLNPWTDFLDDLLDIEVFYDKTKNGVVALEATNIRIHKNCAIIKLRGVDDMTAAEAYRGKTLFVEKEESLPEGRYYVADLIGLKVLTDEGELGTVSDVFNTGANDIYEVKRPGQKPAYLPAISQVVEEINIEEGYMKVHLLDGLLDD
ncbi:MAG: 16S rRNA processing protein RimM [Clostridia bacterium]|nr:16S rRNA processing protein RimM [Clostridia bacterium]